MGDIVRYKSDLFYTGNKIRRDATFEGRTFFTRIREKGLKHGFIEERYDYLYKLIEERDKYVTVKTRFSEVDFYFVKYREHFFRVMEETNDEVFIYTHSYGLYEIYQLKILGDQRDGEYGKWVKREETLPIDKITDRRLAYYRGIVFDIVDERDDEYLISSEIKDGPWKLKHIENIPIEEGWEKVGDRHQKWIPREVLYIYGEEEIPARI